MALEIPTGADSPYLASNPSGTGAVIFGQSPDLLSIHMKNLEAVDKALETQKAERAVANKVASKLLEYKNPDMNGIFPKDREELQKLGKDVVDAHVKLASVDRSNPAWGELYSDAENKKQTLANYVGASKAFNKDITNIGSRVVAGDLKGKADPVFWSNKYTDNIAKPMAERYGDNYESPSTWVKDVTPKLDEMLSTSMSKLFKDYQEPVSSPVEIDKGTFGQKISKMNITPEQAEAMAKSYTSGGYQHSAEAVDEQYGKVADDVKKTYIDANKAKGMNDLVAAEEAKNQWLKDHILLNFQKQQNSYKFDGITPAERAKYKITESQAKSLANGGWLWTMTKGAIDPNSDVSTSQQYTASNGQTIALKGNPALNAIQPQTVTVPIYEKDANGKVVLDAKGNPKQAINEATKLPAFMPMQNHVLSNGYDANGNFILVTSESKYLGDATGDTKKELMVMKPDQAYDYIKTKLGAGKYAQGADLLAAKEGHRNPTTGKVTFEPAKKPVSSQFTEQKVPLAKVTEVKLTPTQWNSKWASLKKGEKLVGLDGKTYTKP